MNANMENYFENQYHIRSFECYSDNEEANMDFVYFFGSLNDSLIKELINVSIINCFLS